MKDKISTLIKTSLSFGLGFFLLWYFFHQMNPVEKEQFYWILKNANYYWILLSIVFSFLAYVIRAERWKLALEPLEYETRFSNRYHSIIIGYIINFFIPRAGEISRATLLSKKEKLRFTDTFGTILSERVVDTIFLGAIALLAYLTNTDKFIFIFYQIGEKFKIKDVPNLKSYFILTLIIVVIISLSVYYTNKKLRTKINLFLKELYKGVISITKMKKTSLYVIYSILIWGCYLAHFWICFYSIPDISNYPFSTILLTFIAGTIGVIIVNGGIGAYPLLVGFALSIADPSHENVKIIGNSLGMLIWSSETFLVILLGVISFLTFKRNNEKK